MTLVDIAEKNAGASSFESGATRHQEYPVSGARFTEKSLGAEFDLIVVSRVLHHMPDLDAALSLFHQHLKEDGQLLLADFTKTEANHHGFDCLNWKIS